MYIGTLHILAYVCLCISHTCTSVRQVLPLIRGAIVGKTSNESKAKYNAKAYDRIQLIVKKGEKEKIQSRSQSVGLSVNAYINELIRKDVGN